MDVIRTKSDIFFKFWMEIIDKISDTISNEGFKPPPTPEQAEKIKANKERMALIASRKKSVKKH